MKLDELIKEYNLLIDEEGLYYHLSSTGEREGIYLLLDDFAEMMRISSSYLLKCAPWLTPIKALKNNRIRLFYELNDLLRACEKYTAGKKYVSDNPFLLKEYSDKNILPADKVIAGTSKKLWWKCSVCCHEWLLSGNQRIKKGVKVSRCPACVNRVVTATNNLVATHPELAKEYSEKNVLPPDKVFAGTHKKFWWTCSVCSHEWRALGSSRVLGTGCPACANKKVTATNNLTVTHPELAKEYSGKNVLPADKVIAGTNTKLWWKCSTCGHEWQSQGNTRASGTGCPSCTKKVITETNNLAVTHPELAKEYSEKNTVPADKVFAGTNTKLWWKCSVCGHEWQAVGSSRVLGTGCPNCANSISVATATRNLAMTHPELAKEYSGKNVLPVDKVTAGSGKKFWWKCSVCNHEWQALPYPRTKGVGCPACTKRAVTPTNNLAVTHPALAREYSEKNNLPADKVVAGTSKKLWWKCSVCGHEWQAVGSSRVLGTGCPACANKKVTATNNLSVTHPQLAKVYSKKNDLPPEKITAGTQKKLWWKCSVCDHEWQSRGSARVLGAGCPACAHAKRRKTKPR